MNLNIVYATVEALGSASVPEIADVAGINVDTVLNIVNNNLDVPNAAFIRVEGSDMLEINPNYVKPVRSDVGVAEAIAEVLCEPCVRDNDVTVALDDSGISKTRFVRGINNLEAFLSASACKEFRNRLTSCGISADDVDAYFQSMVDLATGARAIIAVYGKDGV